MVNVAEVRTEANANIIKVPSELAHNTVGQIQFIVNQIVNQNEKGLILDFTDVDFVDSKGAGFLLGLKKIITGKRQVVLATVSPKILGVLNRMMIAEQFKVCKTVEDALKKM